MVQKTFLTPEEIKAQRQSEFRTLCCTQIIQQAHQRLPISGTLFQRALYKPGAVDPALLAEVEQIHRERNPVNKNSFR